LKFEISNHIAIQVYPLKEATEFYKNVMGMKVLGSDKNEAEIQCGGTIFHVEDSKEGKTFFDFSVDDLDGAKLRLESEGCKLTETFCDQGKSYIVSDPFGLKFHKFQAQI
jgi:catechol 2,3-dioxygenase-like lactoylglutathione lyase family enzyme